MSPSVALRPLGIAESLQMRARLLIDHSTYSLSRNVSIKILRSEFKSGRDILAGLDRLMTGPEDHPGKKHIAQLLDHFVLKGPNGHHLCLVQEALGKGAFEDFPPPKVLWERIKQMVHAVAYAHEVGIIHGGK